ncbi:hypothetical protein COV88_00530 [Candidatus Saccharibacteria bacterium CG11_big_fil_rev_8_21_14_0_20_41_19]|nr:MAG: hypothetical protein COV88_00530 [Candidatus Saccharibacteria bacterium CG11_big_fil_rev_8_21_14_0_20_41_19]PIZ60496.1 MAG: hypothetical protein COY18_01425 [Candidatus Saccharibacteria bacterium CG_4_10_14_0_2_um_filter_41_11]PJC29430.1 MAG: hypothetical protein CO052_03490 [Candidatus Saccharibacteria bacterium CG_4_9_14_0_2_um_filter_41_9]PJE66137.1 MAG: hypothetical protein COU92_02950 [Candidatus Saccharibacteria bacterium CG10_big_fil_rev_8_21_14_0_10_41_32]
MSKRNKWIIGGVAGFVILFVLVAVFGTPSAELVFKDMNEKMLQTKSVTIDQKVAMKGTAEIGSRVYMDFSSNKDLMAKGSFSMDITAASNPMAITGDLIKIGDSNYARFSKLASSNKKIDATLNPVETKLKNEWIKVRNNDQYASFSESAFSFMANILPVPYANLNDVQRKEVLAILQDKSMYTISESSKVETAGVSAYKYIISYNKDQFKKAAKAIAGYVSYFKSDDSASGEITALTIWVNISTKQLIKAEYTGTTDSGEVTGTVSFSDYNKTQTVEKPSDYSIESELLN